MASAGTVCVVGSMAGPPGVPRKESGSEAERITSALLRQRAAIARDALGGAEAGLVAEGGNAGFGVGDVELRAAEASRHRDALIALGEIAVRRPLEGVVDHVARLARRTGDRLHAHPHDAAL